MTLTRGEFAGFFAAVRAGQTPFAWQERLLDDLLSGGGGPDRIDAPTGTGKTAVIDVHVFAAALAGWGQAPRLPRRLALIVDRRFVVDDHDEHARRIAGLLSAAAGGVLVQVAAGLRRLRSESDRPDRDRPPLLTARLRGGTPPPRSWRDDPESALVLTATPDMWGSRLLLAGYGSSRRAWAREAGLLAFDSVAVVDEAHLSRQLLATAARVRDLLGVCEQPLGVPGLQVVQTTATPDPQPGRRVGVVEADLADDPELAARLQRPKPVRLLPLPWPPARESDRRAVLGRVADAVVELHATAGSTVGCVLNRVASAVTVAELLRTRGLVVETLIGRLRPADVHALRRRRPGLLSVHGDPGVDVLVATQTVEVGVDLDLTGLVTELAPATALAQRVGRVNRLGRRATGPITVVVPDQPLTDRSPLAPYQRDELEQASEWLAGIAGDPTGLTPWRVREDPPSVTRPARGLLQRVELADAWQWAYTSDDAFAEPDRQLWLADDLDADLDAGLVVRRGLPGDATDGTVLLRDTPPRPHEVFPLRLSVARRLLERLHGGDPPTVVYRWRAGDVQQLTELDTDLRPDDVLIVADDTPLLYGGVVAPDGRATAEDVFETGRPGAGEATLRLGACSLLDTRTAAPHPTTAVIEGILKAAADTPVWTRAAKRDLADGLAELAGYLAGSPLRGPVEATVALLRGSAPQVSARDVDVLLRAVTIGRDGQPTQELRLVVVDQRRAVADEDLRQTWSRAEQPVTLAEHRAAVAARAQASAIALGLPDTLVQALRLAGWHHDDGKTDPRFQVMLGAEPNGPPLAKSGHRGVAEERQATANSQLPAGWRHEQLSAALAWLALTDRPERELAVRLAGTSHGRGRAGFPHNTAQLLTPPAQAELTAVAADLFDRGDWDTLIEATDRRFGVWGCAYLEAVLRAADGRVSREGS